MKKFQTKDTRLHAATENQLITAPKATDDAASHIGVQRPF